MAAPSAPRVLMLEGSKTGGRWRNPEFEDLLDALPYFDKDYEDPKIKAEVNKMVQEEMRRGMKKPAAFLADLPPAPEVNLANCPMLAKEYERVNAGRPPTTIDLSRYSADQPAISKRADVAAWKLALQNAHIHLQHQSLKLENLELMLKYGADNWRVHNQHLEAFNARLQSQVGEYREQIESLNRDRKLNQQAAAAELSRLEAQWQDAMVKNMSIGAACHELEKEIQSLRKEAEDKGVDLTPKISVR